MTIHRKRRKPKIEDIECDKLKPLVEEYLTRANARNIGYIRGLRNAHQRLGGSESDIEILTSLLRWLQHELLQAGTGQSDTQQEGDLEPVTAGSG